MNARVLVGHAAITERARELDRSFLRRVREASRHELLLMKRAHANIGCELVYGLVDGGCWKCEALRRAGK